MRGWRAWYTDGRLFDNTGASWWRLPRWGCLGVVIYLEPPYRRIIDGHDWIFRRFGRFRSVPTHPEWGRWARRPLLAWPWNVKRGEGVPDEEWARVQAEMLAARETP